MNCVRFVQACPDSSEPKYGIPFKHITADETIRLLMLDGEYRGRMHAATSNFINFSVLET